MTDANILLCQKHTLGYFEGDTCRLCQKQKEEDRLRQKYLDRGRIGKPLENGSTTVAQD